MDKKRYAVCAQVEENYGASLRVVARVCVVNEAGELRNILSTDGDAFADFQVSAYVDENYGVWGAGYSYRDAWIESTDQARAIVRLLSKLDKGLGRIATARGYVGGFGDLVLRVAEVCGIGEIHVRNSARRREMTGETFSVVDGRGFLAWVDKVARTATDEGRSVHREYIAR